MTPSKLNYMDDTDGDSDATVKPLRLLGQQRGRSRSRSPAKSRGRTPSKKPATPSSSKNKTTFVPQGQLPYRLDTPQPTSGFPSIPDSRVKHNQNLNIRDPFQETPPKILDEWPIDSLVTVNNVKKISQPFPEEQLNTVRIPKVKSVPNGIFMNRVKAKEHLMVDLRLITSIIILVVGFFLTLFYRGEILEYIAVMISRIPTSSSPSSSLNIQSDLNALFRDLEILKRDISWIPDFDASGLNLRLSNLEQNDNDRDQLIVDLDAKLLDLKSLFSTSDFSHSERLRYLVQRIDLLGEKAEDALKQSSSTSDTIAEIEKKISAVQSTQDTIQSSLAEFEKSLPERLLIRLSSSGEVVIDQRLYTYLQNHFSGTKSDTSAQEFTNVNMKAVENYVQGKLDILEHKIMNKREVMTIVEEQIKSKLSSLQPSKSAELDLDDITSTILTKLRNESVQSQEMKPNLASESAGCRPLMFLSSKSYYAPSEWSFIKYISWGSKPRPHRLALSSDNSFGNCWAFTGSSGTLSLQLAVPTIPSTFTLCHLSKAFSTDRSSAPANFEVHAIPDISAPDETIILGTYSYTLNGTDCQEFPVHYRLNDPAMNYQLRVLSNHGKQEYTCIYQFGLHSNVK